jgi:hypothetical protein
MAESELITATRLRELLHCDPETGIFTRRKTGRIVGTPNNRGYLVIRAGDRVHKVSRLAWLWMTGEWPKDQIDHANLNKADNRWLNLREATPSQNARNCPRLSSNTSGYKGVSWGQAIVDGHYPAQRQAASAWPISNRRAGLYCLHFCSLEI